MIDDLDKQILTIIQKNARTANSEIAKQVNLAPSAVFERLRKLEERGLIRGYAAELDSRQLGFNLTAYVFVRTDDKHGEAADALAKFPEVLEVHHVAGEDCYLLKVKTADANALGQLLRERISNLANVTSTRTTVVLQTVKETVALPLENCEQKDAGTNSNRRARKSRKEKE